MLYVKLYVDSYKKIIDKCHAKIDLFKVKKIGNFLVFKMV